MGGPCAKCGTIRQVTPNNNKKTSVWRKGLPASPKTAETKPAPRNGMSTEIHKKENFPGHQHPRSHRSNPNPRAQPPKTPAPARQATGPPLARSCLKQLTDRGWEKKDIAQHPSIDRSVSLIDNWMAGRMTVGAKHVANLALIVESGELPESKQDPDQANPGRAAPPASTNSAPAPAEQAAPPPQTTEEKPGQDAGDKPPQDTEGQKPVQAADESPAPPSEEKTNPLQRKNPTKTARRRSCQKQRPTSPTTSRISRTVTTKTRRKPPRLDAEPQGQASNSPHPESQNPWNDLALNVMLGEQADMDRRKDLLSTAIQARSQYLELVAPSA